MNKQVEKIINKYGYLSERDDYYDIYIDNRCCEDYPICVEKGKTREEIEDIINQCDNFDVNEHFSLWFGANRGEPKDVRTLLENCEEIGDKLDNLAQDLKSYLARY